MELLTKELEAKLPRIGATENVPLDEKMLLVKYFHPMSSWTWYGVEYDPKTKTFFGFVQGFEDEWGYFSLVELNEVTVRGCGVERDLYFKPTKFGNLLT